MRLIHSENRFTIINNKKTYYDYYNLKKLQNLFKQI